MTEPIDPKDHRVYDPAYNVQFDEARHTALIEAIHQTFERDEHNLAEIAKHKEWLASGDAPYNEPEVVPWHAPDTDIDRLARLIVDGEYRRRKATSEGKPEQ